MTVTQHTTDDRFLSARQLRARYGDVTAMTIHRWLHDAELGFPRPKYFGRLRFWHERDLIALERRCASMKRVTR
jgi:hypothetical protein